MMVWHLRKQGNIIDNFHTALHNYFKPILGHQEIVCKVIYFAEHLYVNGQITLDNKPLNNLGVYREGSVGFTLRSVQPILTCWVDRLFIACVPGVTVPN